MRMRRLPQDDYLHPAEEVVNYNESRYYNFYDEGCGLGGWFRMGNRPNEGYAEMTVCLYLPDGRVAFMFKRPEIDSNDEHNAGGLRFEPVRPYEEHRVEYEGNLVLLDNPRDMEDPRTAFTNNPRVRCRFEQTHTALAQAWGGEPEPEEGEDPIHIDPEKAFARGHTEQHMRVRGTVQIGDDAFPLDRALGLRDHSWGPRYWQNIWWYRWLTVNLGPDVGFATTISGSEDGRRRSGGFLYDRRRYGDDQWVPIRDVELSSDYDDSWYHHAVEARIHTDDHIYDVRGDVWSNMPLRNRREGQMTRILEGMTTWYHDDLVGSGLAEYLDQIVDGLPVGTKVGV